MSSTERETKAEAVPSAAFLGVLGASAVGWACAGDDGAAAIVELYIGGQLVDQGPASRKPTPAADLATLTPAQPAPAVSSSEGNWFSLKTPTELRLGQKLDFTLKVGGEPLGGGVFQVYSGLKAKFVSVQGGLVQGFVANTHTQDELPLVEVRVDGLAVGQVRPDLPASEGRRRFVFRLPSDIRDGEAHKISVCWAGSNVELPGSPRTWTAPEPGVDAFAFKGADETDRTRPEYRVPPAEIAVVADLLADQALRRAAAGAVADHTGRLWTMLASAPARRRLTIVLSATTFAQVERAFAISQLLEIDPSALVRVVLPSEEAVRTAADERRDDGQDQLAAPLATAAFRAFAAGLQDDDIVVFIPSGAILSANFLADVTAVLEGERSSVATPCAQAALTPEGMLIVAPSQGGWSPTRAAAAVVHARDLERFVRTRRYIFEGVRFDEVEIFVGEGALGAVALQAPGLVSTSKAKAAVLIGSEASAASCALAGQAAETVVLAEQTTFEPSSGLALARMAGGDGDVLLLDVAKAASFASLGLCRALASERCSHALRFSPGIPLSGSVEALSETVERGLSQPVFGIYVPGRRRTLRA